MYARRASLAGVCTQLSTHARTVKCLCVGVRERHGRAALGPQLVHGQQRAHVLGEELHAAVSGAGAR
jgi:hypothetical protein